ncbi:MAG TPA: hypothetical protein DCZ94_10225 [Lentisphaeria bacterium]|nr:MAG: hypothetical protein A2X48_11100 [Lentisphaerae bacterium GWF2_49_21]HBC87320.1 hypothetical protein [Lentisphaeria bacterium]
MKILHVIFIFVFLSCCLLGKDAIQIKVKSEQNPTIYINGFFYDKNVLKSKSFCKEYLVDGKNSIVIEPALKTKIDLTIEKKGDDNDELIFSFNKEISEKTVVEFDLKLPSIRWAWQDGEEIKSISGDEEATVKEAANKIIRGYEHGEFKDLIDSTMKPYIENYAKANNISNDASKEAFLSAYSEFLSKEKRTSFEIGNSDLSVESSRYNNKIARVFRKNGEYLCKMGTKLGALCIYQFYFIKKDNKWLLQ